MFWALSFILISGMSHLSAKTRDQFQSSLTSNSQIHMLTHKYTYTNTHTYTQIFLKFFVFKTNGFGECLEGFWMVSGLADLEKVASGANCAGGHFVGYPAIFRTF